MKSTVFFLFLLIACGGVHAGGGRGGGRCNTDYVVVGGGVAGSVFARRAAEDGNTVRILERGGVGIIGPLVDLNANQTPPYFASEESRIPRMGVSAVDTIEAFPTAIQEDINLPNNTNPAPFTFAIQASVLGGGSKVNGLLYLKPEISEFTTSRGWPLNWNADNIEKAFAFAENGPLSIEQNTVELPILTEFFQAAPQFGVSAVSDINSQTERLGTTLSPLPRRNGRRLDAFTAYVEGGDCNVRSRIDVSTNFRVDKIIIGRNKKAREVRGVNLVTGEEQCWCAKRGVVMAAGAINTPLVLEKSGIGKESVLNAAGITQEFVSDNVGEGLQDHIGFQTLYIIETRDNDVTDLDFLQAQYQQYLQQSTGFFADTGINAVSLDKVDNSDVTNFQSSFLIGGNTRYTPDVTAIGTPLFVTHSCNNPFSRGSVHLPSQTSFLPFPVVDPNYGSDPRDIDCLVQGVKKFRSILNATGMLLGEKLLNSPNGAILSLEDTLDPARDTVENVKSALRNFALAGTPYSALHYGGSVALGTAVNPETMELLATKVGKPNQRLKDLYVVDSSLFPTVPRANTMATTYAVAEYASSLILNDDRFDDDD